MRRFANRLLARLHRSLTTRRRLSRLAASRPPAKRDWRPLGCEPLEARRQLASITLTLTAGGLLQLTDSGVVGTVANDSVLVTEDGLNVEINLGAGNSFASDSTGFGVSGTPVAYSPDNSIATIAKTAIASVDVVLDNIPAGGGQDTITWSLADSSAPLFLTVPPTMVTANVLSFTDNVVLAGDLTIVADSLTVDGTMEGPHNISVTGAAATFRGQLGTASNGLGDGVGVSVALFGPAGAFSFEDDVYLANGATAAESTDVVFVGNYDSEAGDTTLSGNVTIAGDRLESAGAVTLGTAGATPSKELRIASPAATQILSESDSVTIQAATVLESDLQVRASAGDIQVAGPIDGLSTGAQSIHFSAAGTTTLNGAIGGTVPLRAVFADLPGTTVLGANIAVSGGAATFNNPVVVAAHVTLVGRSGSRIEFYDTVNGDVGGGGDSLTLDCPSGSYFQAAVGGTEPIGDDTGAAITVVAGSAEFDSSVATDSGIIQKNAAGLVIFRGAVNLGAGDTASIFNANVLLAGITFSSAGNVTFGNSTSDTLLVQGSLTTLTRTDPATGVDFTLNSTTTLAADLLIQSGDGNITVNGRIDDELAGTHDLTLESDGLTTINALIGDTAAPNSLTASGSGASEIAATLSVGPGGLLYNVPVMLVGDISLIVHSGNAMFKQTVTGGASLTLDVDGLTSFDGAVGGTGGLEAIGDGSGEALVILSTGATHFFGNVTTNSGIRQSEVAGTAEFHQDVTIGAGDPSNGTASMFDADVLLEGSNFSAERGVRFGRLSGGATLAIVGDGVAIRTVDNDGDLVFAAQVDGPVPLTLAAAGSGSITFFAPVGSLATPTSLTVESANTVTFHADATVEGDIDVTASDNITVLRLLSSISGSLQLETTSGGNIVVESLAAATAVDLRADGAVQLSLPDRLPVDITAPLLRITAQSGIGSAFPLKTDVGGFAAANASSGDVRIFNKSVVTLDIDLVLGLSGISNTATGGAVAIRNETLVAVRRPIVADGAISLTSIDTAANNLIAFLDSVQSTSSTVSVSSGDDILLLAGPTITAAGKITLAGDTSGTEGSMIMIQGNVVSAAASAESIAIITGGGPDSIVIRGQLQTNASGADAIVVSTGAGNDSLTIDSNFGTAVDGGTVDGLLSRLTYRAGTGNDSLSLDNSGKTGSQNVTITPLAGVSGLFAGAIASSIPNGYFAAGSNLSYDNLENVALSTGAGNDVIDAAAFFNSGTARRTNFIFRENANTDSDTLSLNYTLFPESSSPYVLATTSNGRALAGNDSAGRTFGSLRWDDIESVQAVVPRIVGTVPANALFLAGRTLFNDIAQYTGTTASVALNVNGINFESHAGIQALIAYGRSGNDRITVDNPAISIPAEFRGEQGADFLSGGAAADRIFGDLETDTAGGRDTIFGQGGNDTLFGFAADDLIHGNQGDDRIEGGNGNDVLYGNEGQDIVRGGAGNDVLYGVSGNDVLLGDAGNDKLYAGTQRSLLIGGGGSDYLYGQNGDILVGGQVANAANDADLLHAINVWAPIPPAGPLPAASATIIRSKLGTVTDTERDFLTGSATTSVLDWFFASATDVFTRRAVGDLFN